MKKCNYCGGEYPDDLATCPADQHELVDWTPSSDVPDHPAPWLSIAVISVWLLTNFLLLVLLDPLASLLLCYVIAAWAAVDCRKIQLRGSRLLGLQFKPVVVFAVCAFFCIPFGFVWYWVMRQRVLASPLDQDGDLTIPEPSPVHTSNAPGDD